MPLRALAVESSRLADALYAVLAVPRFDDTERIKVSDVSCSMALEHWDAIRVLIPAGLLPSALVVHRAQFEALLRSVWVLYAALPESVSRLAATLSLESEQAAKNMPSANEMMGNLEKKAPAPAYDALRRFKDNSWKALNSYAHAGVHPIQRHAQGYPIALMADVLRNANGLAVISGMQAAVLSGRQALVGEVRDLGLAHVGCMPAPL